MHRFERPRQIRWSRKIERDLIVRDPNGEQLGQLLAVVLSPHLQRPQSVIDIGDTDGVLHHPHLQLKIRNLRIRQRNPLALGALTTLL